MANKKYCVLRSKQLKLSVSEERALEIIKPLTEVTAYVLDLKTIGEVPDIKSFSNMVINSKTSLAKLLAGKTGKVFEPNRLTITSVLSVVVSGYFVLVVHYYSDKKNEKGDEIVDSYTVRLMNEKGIILHDCLLQKEEAQLGRKLTEDELSKSLDAITRL